MKGSNVFRLHSRLFKNTKQLTYYTGGKGPFAKVPNVFGRMEQSVARAIDIARAPYVISSRSPTRLWLSFHLQTREGDYLWGVYMAIRELSTGG